ncbi:MAG TPA: MraY family glycosyltransferase [Candidatus Limnocylindrales bacterium]|nr:MraY family glycosyltransferase [Candidatus Limnocylindrales bacterium]
MFPLDPTLFQTFSLQKFAPAVLPFLAALAATAIAVLPARWLSFRLGAVAEPGGRHIHARPIARLGGLAMYVGFGVSAAVYSTNRLTLGLLLSAAVITTLMVLDDLHGMSPLLKLASQVAASLLAIVVFGFDITYVSVPGGVITFAPWAAILVSLLWFTGLQNTINLIDGVDGLAAGVVAIVAGAILLAAINLLRPDIVILAGALIGACVGFLIFNWHPARIIMGDAGSHFLGFTLAAISVLSVAKGAVVLSLAVPLLALAIPILDTGWAIVRRRVRGQSIAEADAEHLHHRLLDFGLSAPETVLIFYFGTAICAAIGLAIYGHKKVLLGAVILLLVGVGVILGRVTRRNGRP